MITSPHFTEQGPVSTYNPRELAVAELVRTTAKIHFHELQRQFAQGIVYSLDAQFDLIDVASKIIVDDAEAIAALIEQGALRRVEDPQARVWLEQATQLWCSVVAPYVLVQPLGTSEAFLRDDQGVGVE